MRKILGSSGRGRSVYGGGPSEIGEPPQQLAMVPENEAVEFEIV